MAASDITVSGLNKVGAEDAAYLVSKIRTIPGFPKEGILFRDFMPVLADARAFGILIQDMLICKRRIKIFWIISMEDIVLPHRLQAKI